MAVQLLHVGREGHLRLTRHVMDPFRRPVSKKGQLAYGTCRERSKLDMALAHMRAQMEQVVEADMEALQVPALAHPVGLWATWGLKCLTVHASSGHHRPTHLSR